MSEFYLSAKGLLNCANSNLQNDFVFIVGSKEYPCNSLLADFISSKAAELHIQNPHAESLTIDVSDPYDVFSVVMQLMNGEEIDVIPSNIKYIRRIAKAIGNQELLREFSYLWRNEQLTLTNCVQIAEEKYENKDDITAEIEYIAANFFQIAFDQLDGMDIYLFEMVFTHPSLILEDETKTFNFVFQQCQKYGYEYVTLFKYIIFENTKKEDINLFLEKILKKYISADIFEAIKHRLCQPLTTACPTDSTRYHIPSITLLFDPEKDLFHGIFHYLIHRSDQDIFRTGQVVLKSKGENSSNSLDCIFNSDKRTPYGMSDTKDNYVLIDFKSMQVQITGYSIASGSGPRWSQPISWVIEGKNNPREDAFYTIIDEKKQNSDMGGSDKTHYWDCAKSKPYQFIRWRLTQGNGGSINFRQMELFGILLHKPIKK
ncbi:hypothetical protein TVAG_316140 [Trichomonas vaginalis G3]|uniref:BTB domain-containing protein n=1 Tax=Trichomonas vaginalis (strain ATCC PRA-98 / G3) TaxID=412133 RepID=A2FAX2_TRIV3|nr:protein ubiquitination [Trichomonas vaginalis G3]EAX97949.1 hypothetical protein TVAG_316140 [Trichomonas vaginalis G3]KAI5502545.1 protein ubiquitination [Trichomonas vaginalis G3]|eukprot:XP_001310879.1 hypothetical protein [Trichomonas vaginalis G3]